MMQKEIDNVEVATVEATVQQSEKKKKEKSRIVIDMKQKTIETREINVLEAYGRQLGIWLRNLSNSQSKNKKK